MNSIISSLCQNMNAWDAWIQLPHQVRESQPAELSPQSPKFVSASLPVAHNQLHSVQDYPFDDVVIAIHGGAVQGHVLHWRLFPYSPRKCPLPAEACLLHCGLSILHGSCPALNFSP